MLKFSSVICSAKSALIKTTKPILTVALLTSQLICLPGVANNGLVSFYGSYSGLGGAANRDKNKPATGRSYFVTQVEETQDGAKLIAEFYHGDKNMPVEMHLVVAVNDGKGEVIPIPFKKLQDAVADNPTNYYSKREYNLNYADLNAELQKILPQNAKHLKIGPGTPLFALAYWPTYGHTWGGIDRGGIFFMPEDKTGASTQQSAGKTRRVSELDLAYPIPETMAAKFNSSVQVKNSEGVMETQDVGLKIGGQIRSRLEAEGKFQIPMGDSAEVKKALFALTEDPSLAQKVLGPDWKIEPELRYMLKDKATGEMIKGADGLPIPDPMKDTYYDRADSLGAKNDMAIRYRRTEGNGTEAWNFKPGKYNLSPEGVIYRLEFGVDSTDSKPESIRKFVDSVDPLNPFKMIREAIPGAVPSTFLNPSVEIHDVRYKFKLTHSTGLVIEISHDEVTATSLRNKSKTAKYVQLEMDVDHLATASKNTAQAAGSGLSFQAKIEKEVTAEMRTFLEKTKGNAFIDGRSVMHTLDDLAKSSPVYKKHQTDFTLAEGAIKSLRDHLLGRHWIPAPQKASLAAVLLEQVSEKDASKSVKTMMNREQELRRNGILTDSIFNSNSKTNRGSSVNAKACTALLK